MRRCSAVWGAPDLGQTVSRTRLLGALAQSGTRPVVIAAPSGWGKTVLASQHVSAIPEARVLWLDLADAERLVGKDAEHALDGGTAHSASLVLPRNGVDDDVSRLLSGALRVVAEGDKGRSFIVVDNWNPCSDVQLIDGIHAARIASGLGSQMIFLTRQYCRDLDVDVSEAILMSETDLSLTASETGAILGQLGVHADSWATLHEDCGGHVAALLALARVDVGQGAPILHSAPLRIWIERLLKQLEPDARRLANTMALMLGGELRDLTRLGVSADCRDIARVAAHVPLLRLSVQGDEWVWRAHDALFWHALEQAGGDQGERLLQRVADHLARESRFAHGLAVARKLGTEALVAWLEVYGRGCVHSGVSAGLSAALEAIPSHVLLEHPRLLLDWALAALDQGHGDDALARAKAASTLARGTHSAAVEQEARAVATHALLALGRFDEAYASITTALGDHPRNGLLRAHATAALCAGWFQPASDAILAMLSADGLDTASREDALRFSALVRACGEGDFAGATSTLSRLGLADEETPSARVQRLGNLASALVETGRCSRSRQIVSTVLQSAGSMQQSAFRCTHSCALCASGRVDEARSELEASVQHCIRSRNDADLAVNRVYQSMMLRAEGQEADALMAAERALEYLATVDYFGFRRLATIEVAASLLALGDVAAARRWTEPLVAAGFEPNKYHALRAAMVLAECDRRDGALSDAIARLAEHRDHILSESSNWQMAMYCRAFPELLGMLAMAIGAADLPVHMLNMVLPEHADRSLRVCQGWMPEGEWRTLGARLLGEPELERLVARRGRPVCRVRLFGGLDVTVGDITIAERDWAKRKARLLFAVLVSERGRDVARDRILDHLWPELDEERARNNFYVTWSAMKSALGTDEPKKPSPYVQSARGRCRVLTEAVRSDIDEFEESLAAARVADVEGDLDAAISAYQHVSAVYRGDLLPGDVYDDWFSAARDRYRSDFVDAMLRLSDRLLQRDDPYEALVYARRGLQVDPIREDLYQAALRCQIAAGQRSGAVETFIACKTQLSEELGLDPSADTMALYQQVLGMEECPRRDTYGLPDPAVG